jgi:AcrR family transcriptional regulator
MEKRMSKKEEKSAKRRIFEAATSLFARKGYSTVTTREIATNADVNLSLLNYYYGGKVGILKEIVNQCYDRYFAAIRDSDNENADPQERVRLIAKSLVRFFRENTELAMVGLNVLPIDLPEIVDLKVKWVMGSANLTQGLFRSLGVNFDNPIEAHVFSGLLTTIVSSHFQSRYAWEHVLEAAAKSKKSWEHLTKEHPEKLDDSFYDKYSDMLVDLYLHGLTGITKKRKPRKGVKDGTQNS